MWQNWIIFVKHQLIKENLKLLQINMIINYLEKTLG